MYCVLRPHGDDRGWCTCDGRGVHRPIMTRNSGSTSRSSWVRSLVRATVRRRSRRRRAATVHPRSKEGARPAPSRTRDVVVTHRVTIQSARRRTPTRADPRARPRGARHVSVHVVRGHDWSMMQWSRGHTREAVARRMRARDASEPRRGSATFVHFASVDRSIDALVRVGSTRARGGRRRTFAGASWCWRPSARVDCVEDETRAHASAR